MVASWGLYTSKLHCIWDCWCNCYSFKEEQPMSRWNRLSVIHKVHVCQLTVEGDRALTVESRRGACHDLWLDVAAAGGGLKCATTSCLSVADILLPTCLYRQDGGHDGMASSLCRFIRLHLVLFRRSCETILVRPLQLHLRAATEYHYYICNCVLLPAAGHELCLSRDTCPKLTERLVQQLTKQIVLP